VNESEAVYSIYSTRRVFCFTNQNCRQTTFTKPDRKNLLIVKIHARLCCIHTLSDWSRSYWRWTRTVSIFSRSPHLMNSANIRKLIITSCHTHINRRQNTILILVLLSSLHTVIRRFLANRLSI